MYYDKEIFTSVVKDFIRSNRLETEITQDKLSEAAEIDVDHLSRLENAKRTPGAHTLFKLIIAMDLDANEITKEYLKRLKKLE